ncbi:MAG: cation:proton antiporter [Bdellovibrionota bacterium]
MHLAPLIRDLAIILAVAGIVTFLFQRIRQPVVLGYIIAGFIIGPHTPPFPLVTDIPNIKVWAELGVIFLMFSLGLEFSFRKLAKVGVSASITAIVEVIFMMSLGFACGKLFGWSFYDSLFLSAMLSISSTTIIIKALDELGLKSKRFAQVIFGVLIVEDLVAILILVALSTLAMNQSFSVPALALSSAKLFLVVGVWFIVGYFLVPRIVRAVGKTGSDEMLTTLSLGLCLLLVVAAAELDYSVALGAFIMGSILAESTESHRIEELIKPLRDVFAAIFFVSVGMLMEPSTIWEYRWPVLIITLITVVGKIFSTTAGALLTGQTLKTSVQVGFGLAQIGEFSFIIASLGLTLGVTSDFLYPVGVAVSLLTTLTTPYLIRVSHKSALAIERRLPARAADFLARYVAWSEQRRISTANRSAFYRQLLKWFVNGVVVTAIWVMVARFANPVLEDFVKNPIAAHAGAWMLAILISAPFTWAMMTTAYAEGKNPLSGGSYTFLIQILTLLWLGAVSLAFFPAKYVGISVAALSAIFFAKFYRRLEASYHWFERQFLSTFDASEKKSKHPSDALKRLAPWNAHLVQLRVHPDSDIAGKAIAKVELRKRFGLNIVAIHRGSRTLISPEPDSQIFPKDELLVLGTDEQVDAARSMIEKPPGIVEHKMHIDEYELMRLFIDDVSPLLGRSIRDSKIRENYGAMVVGIERRGRRIMNPDTDMVLEIEDYVLIVGQSDRVSKLIQDLGPKPAIQKEEA